MNTTKKLKWLLALVLIFGGFTLYKLFEGLGHNPDYLEYEWLFKIISEFGLFVSVIVSVGYFHHWFIAAEEHKGSSRFRGVTTTCGVRHNQINAGLRHQARYVGIIGLSHIFHSSDA